jgi:RHS repeat-associated protein
MYRRTGRHTLYLYGLSRIGELQPGGFLYHLTDALGSVRQLVDTSGAVKLARSYEPYGGVLSSSGNASSAYGFVGESQANGLVYLRARYYAEQMGRYLSEDSWRGNPLAPVSYNGWLYTNGNPLL